MENEDPQSGDAGKTKDQEYCEKQSDEAFTLIIQQQAEQDKQLLALSSGLLAVIMAFLKDIVHLDIAIFKAFLYTGFMFLGLTIVSVIISFQVSVFANEKAREYWQKRYDGKEPEFPEAPSNWVKRFNRYGCFCFVAGVAFVILFITLNLASPRNAENNNIKEAHPGLQCQRNHASRDATVNGSGEFQKANQCPQGEYCTYRFTVEENVGIPMQNSKQKKIGQPIESPPIQPGLPVKPPIKNCANK
jgi:hypothetical protein